MTFNETTATSFISASTNDFAIVSIDIPSNNISVKTVIYPSMYDRWILPL